MKNFLLINFFEGYEELYVTPSESNISIISRFPIIDTYDYNLYGIGASLMISDDDTLKFISSHLSAYPYGPYDLYEGYSTDEVMENEMTYRYQENLDIYIYSGTILLKANKYLRIKLLLKRKVLEILFLTLQQVLFQ